MDNSNELRETIDWFFIKSDRNGNKLVVRNYEYRLDSQNEKNAYYKCDDKNCKARATHRKLTNTLEVNNVAHEHQQSGIKIAQRTFRNELKLEVEKSPSSPIPQLFKGVRRKVVNEGVNGANSEEVNQAMPLFNNIRSVGYRKRAKLMPTLPQSRQELIIEGDWKLTNNGRNFLLALDGTVDKIAVFGTSEFLITLCKANTVYMDGTFKSSPAIFYQVYTLHCYSDGIMVPAVYCLLPNKSTETYVRMFSIIRHSANSLSYEFKPANFQVDFECGIIAAINQYFGETVNVKFCLFHFGQSIWRNIVSLGLKSRYSTDSNFQKFVRRIMAMALIPLDKLDAFSMAILLEAPNDNDVDTVWEYFNRTYFDSLSARFNRSKWNHYATEHTRTINNLEGWHFCLNRAILRNKPNIFQFITAIKNQQEDFEHDLCATINGNTPKKMPRKYRKLEYKLVESKIMLEQNTITLLEYVDRIKYHYNN